MRFAYLATVLAVSLAVFAPVDISAQAPGARSTRVRHFEADDEGHGQVRRRPGASVDDEAVNLVRMRRIGGDVSGSSDARRAAYNRRELARSRREVAAVNKEIKAAQRAADVETTQQYQADQKAAREAGDAQYTKSIENYPAAGQRTKQDLRKTELDVIPASQNKVRVDSDRVKQWTKQLESFKPENAIAKDAGFAAVDQVKIVPLGKNRVGNNDKYITAPGSWVTSKAIDTQKYDIENLKHLDQVRKTNVPQYVLAKDANTGNIIPMTPDQWNNARYEKNPASGYSRYEDARSTVTFAQLPAAIEKAARKVQQNEADRMASRLEDAKAKLGSSEALLKGNENTRNTLATTAKTLDEQWGAKPELKQKPKNPLSVLNEGELNSANDFMEDPAAYFHKKRAVTVNVEIDA